MFEKHRNCLVCQSGKIKPLKGYYDRHGLVKCGNCGFVFMERIPTLEELGKHYSTYSYSGDSELSPITVKSYSILLDEFEKYRKTNRLLDVGCGRGWFLIEAKKRGWEVYGTEYSDAAVAICRKNGIEMKTGKLNPADFSNQDFDVITSFEVIEHINNPREELTNIRTLLRSGGLFYCTTPNFNSLLRYYLKSDYNVIEYPEHLSYYTRSTLNRLARDAGFKPIRFLSTGISVTRIISSQSSDDKPITEEQRATDERIRQNIESKSYLGMVKKIVNSVFTVTNLGMTLKGYYEKP